MENKDTTTFSAMQGFPKDLYFQMRKCALDDRVSLKKWVIQLCQKEIDRRKNERGKS